MANEPMSTESARKAAENNEVYKELRQIYCCQGAEFCRPTLEKARKEIERLSAACQTVAPPPDNIRDAHLFLSHYVAHVGHDADCGCNICRAFRLLDSSGAAPAVSTPPDLLTRYKRALEGLTPGGSEFVDDPERCAAHARARQDSLWEQVKKLKRTRAPVSTPRCPKCGEREQLVCVSALCGNVREVKRDDI